MTYRLAVVIAFAVIIIFCFLDRNMENYQPIPAKCPQGERCT